jgi:hypothetical protein
VDVDSVTVGGATLQSLWIDGTAPARIASGGFDVVVLQGNSLEAFGTADFFYPYAQRFAGAVHDAGARTVWYATWARRPGDSFYGFGATTPEFMTRSIDHAYRRAAEQWGGTVARAGAAWQLARAEQPGVELYAPDGSHPSPAGTLLTACTMFLALTGREAVLPDPAPLGIDRATATALCALAPRVLCGPSGCGCENAAQVTTSYTALRAMAPACDGSTERRGLECNAAMDAVCAGTPCVNGGFGAAAPLPAGDAVDVTCAAGTTLHTTYAALAALDAACDGTTERYGPNCATAVDRACVAAGALGGFGPTEVSGDDVTMKCVPRANGRREHFEYSMFVAGDSNCLTQRWGPDCDIAVDAFCRTNGFAGGFGPTEISGTSADFVCVSW